MTTFKRFFQVDQKQVSVSSLITDQHSCPQIVESI